MADAAKLDQIADVIRRNWPVEIESAAVRDPALIRDIEGARAALLKALELNELV